MVDGLRIPLGNRTKKPLSIALSGTGRRLRRKDDAGNVTMYNVSLIRIVTMNLPV
jgi:hypothetical protein